MISVLICRDSWSGWGWLRSDSWHISTPLSTVLVTYGQTHSEHTKWKIPEMRVHVSNNLCEYVLLERFYIIFSYYCSCLTMLNIQLKVYHKCICVGKTAYRGFGTNFSFKDPLGALEQMDISKWKWRLYGSIQEIEWVEVYIKRRKKAEESPGPGSGAGGTWSLQTCFRFPMKENLKAHWIRSTETEVVKGTWLCSQV